MEIKVRYFYKLTRLCDGKTWYNASDSETEALLIIENGNLASADFPDSEKVKLEYIGQCEQKDHIECDKCKSPMLLARIADHRVDFECTNSNCGITLVLFDKDSPEARLIRKNNPH